MKRSGRALISGASGFLGSHLCDRLLAEGLEVYGIDNLLTGDLRNLAHLGRNRRFRFIRKDVSRRFTFRRKFDYVIHAASPASPKDYLEHPLETLDVGSSGTRNMLEVANRSGARFLLLSTSECYGDPLVHPQVETYWGNVNPVGPRSCYDESKRFAEALTVGWRRAKGVNTGIARIFNTYGPRMKLNDGRVVPAFVDQALRGEPITVFGNGTQTRSFCYVSDLVEGLYRLLLSDEPMPTNIGNPNEMTIIQFAEVIRDLVGKQVKIIHKDLPEDDPKQRKPDISKAIRLLKWRPVVSLEEGLSKTIDYFRSLPDTKADRVERRGVLSLVRKRIQSR
jgi:dTDP-glucose 4,6-dehydratase